MTGMDSVVVALALHAAPMSPATAFATPAFLASLPCAGTEGAYSEIYGVRSDGHSAVFVAANSESRVYKFDLAGHEIAQWSSPYAHGIALSPSGEVFVSSDSEFGVIDVYSSSGAHLRQFGRWGGPSGGLQNPTWLYVTPEGTLLVSDSQNQQVVECDADGNRIRSWGGPGTAAGKFAGPRGIAMDGAGEVLVCDEGNSRVQVFSRTGAFLRQWPIRSNLLNTYNPVPRGIVIDDLGRIYIADRLNSRVRVFQSDGTEIGSWGGSGLDPGYLFGPSEVEVDMLGRIYVGESNCHVQVFGRDGTTALPRVTWGALKARYR